MLKHISLLLLTTLLIGCTNSLNNSLEQDIKRLDKTLLEQPSIDAAKRLQIDSLYRASALAQDAYPVYLKLYEEYRSYNYDTALLYCHYMHEEASTPFRQAQVQLCQAFVYLSGGLFKEAADILEQWHSTDTTLLKEYYITYARLLWDMADNAQGDIGALYNNQGLELSALLQTHLSPQDTLTYWYNKAVSDLREGNEHRSMERCLMALRGTTASTHDKAIVTSTLAHLYRMTGDNDQALHYYIEAAICDIRSSTYETVALRNVAELLYERGETQLADRYIHMAMHDANRYHARYRQVSIAQSLPIIEQKMLSTIRQQQQLARSLLIIVGILLLGGGVGIGVMYRKNGELKTALDTIDRISQSLGEANKLKEELLGTLLTSRSQYINAVQQYQQDVKQNATNRRWSVLLSIPKAADARIQRTILDRQIDTIFLSIYPHFIEDFNNLLRPDARLTLKKDELLNAQLRIFALIRLGITHNEVIAEILNYSINTVYNYKTRVMAQSDLTPDAFMAALMDIPSFTRNR